MKKRKLIFSLLLVLIIILPLSFYLWNKSAQADWWNSDWFYRKLIPVTNSSGGVLTDFQIKILNNYDLSGDVSSGKIQTDLDDLRFTLDNGESLDYWIEDNTNSSVDIWLRIPSIPTTGITIYMYYGNSQATVFSDGNKVFDFFDDFNDSNIDPNKWIMENYGSGGSFAELNGQMSLTGSNNQTGSATAKSPTQFKNNFVIEWRRYDTEEHYNDLSFGYGNVVAEGNGTSYWHTTAQYGYINKVQDNSSSIYNRINNGSALTLQTGIDGPNSGQWVKYKNVYSNAGLWNWYYDIGPGFALLGTGQTDATYLNDSKYILLARGGYSGNTWGGTSQYDYIFVHKYASTEPVIGTIGQEERGPSPTLYLPFDEGFGSTAHDETSNRNDGTIVGATWKDESNCKSGKCLEFDGTGDYVEINDNNSLDLSNELTLEAWVKPQSTTPINQTILSKVETPSEPTKIFRSVGPSATTAIAVGTTNAMTIVGDRATFTTALPDNVGVGDAIQYDDDDDSDIDASDSLAFIVERITNYEYRITNASGGTAVPVNSDTNWSLFRAYTSLANAESGTENTGIDVDLVNFDTWSGGKDLVASNEQWNIACYANGTTADTINVIIDGWTTGVNNSIKIYTPVSSNEVGITQRHNGKWDDNKYKIEDANSTEYTIRDFEEYIWFEGLQIFSSRVNYQKSGINVSNTVSANSNIKISNNILKANFTGTGNSSTHGGISLTVSDNVKVFIWNNTIYNWNRADTTLSGIVESYGDSILFNNTIYNTYYGIYKTQTGDSFIKNNIIQNNNSGIVGTFISSSTNNLSNNTPSATSAFGSTYTTGTTNATTASKLVNSTETFITKGVRVGSIIKNTTDNTYTYVTALDSETQLSIANDIFVSGENYSIYTNKYGTASFISTTSGSEDFHLNPTDTVAKNSGADLSGDNFFPFNSDIDGQQRLYLSNGGPNFNDTKFDIGADEAQATQIFRSVAPSKTDALETGVGNSLTIAGDPANGSGAGTATFQRALADNVGVGDAIQYDDDNDSDIDASDSLVFISGRVSSFEFQVTTASGGVPVQVINDNDWSLFRAYTSLADAENGTENTGIDSDLRNFDSWTGGKDLVTSKEQWNIACYANGTTADTTAVTVDNWTTGVQNFVKIYTPVTESEVGVSQGHNGRWDDGKYKLVTTGNNGASSLVVQIPYTKIIGLQVHITTTGNQASGIIIRKTADIFSCIVKSSGDSTFQYANGIYVNCNEYSQIIKIFNCIVFSTDTATSGSVSYGFYLYDFYQPKIYLYNSTAYSYGLGIRGDVSDGKQIVKNCVSFNSRIGNDFDGVFYSGDSNNISNDATAPGTGSLINQTLTDIDFVSTNAGSEDLHLLGTSVARNAGVNLFNDFSLPIKTDIDGENRLSQGSFDIGADEAVATKIYRSVGPGNTSALATDEAHENTVSVTDGRAIFSEGLPNRVGVGDAVLIDTNSDNAITSADTLLFIYSRISSTVYTLRTHTGALPSNISSNDTYQIYRAYTSLANAESGTKNTAIPITFNGGNRDLVANNEEWNIACYGDSVNTGQVQIQNWTTGIENYLNIYTPFKPSEVGVSQRHDGKWNSRAFTFNYVSPAVYEAAINIYDDFVRISGLQVYLDPTNYSANTAIGMDYIGSMNRIEIDNNIIKKKNISEDSTGISGGSNGGQAQNAYIHNNLIYNFRRNDGYGTGIVISMSNSNAYIFNNTVYNCGFGINRNNGNVVSKNNLVQNSANGYNGTFATGSDFNISDLAGDAPGSNSKNSTTVTFRDVANDDFRLAMNDTSAKGAGLNLSNDINLSVTSDIEGEKRPSLVTSHQSSMTNFDIGADQISTTTHNNYSLNLKTNYPQANFSTSENDKDNFSSGDVSLEANKWSHLVYKRSTGAEELFINGSKKDSSSITNFLKTNNGKLYLGADNTNSKNSFKGLLDEVRIYPYARTETEIKKDTTQGSSGRASSRASEGVGIAIGDKSTSINDGLVGYWKMDEASWTGAVNEVKDASGNNNHGVRNGDANAGAGRFGNGGNFDGTGDYVEKNSPTNIPSLNTPITISLWAKATNANYGRTMVDLYNGSASGSITLQTIGWGGNVKFSVAKYGDANLVSTSDANSFPANTWIHYTYTFDGTTHRIYRDGKLDNYSNTAPDTGIANKISIGRRGVGTPNEFTGNLDEVRIYNRALNENEIQQLYNYAPAPVLHLKMDEKSGTTAFDSSGNSYNGTLNNGPIWETGKLNSSLNFPVGANTYVQNSADLTDNWSSFTIGTWVKTDVPTNTGGAAYISKYRSGFGGWRMLKDRNNATGKFMFYFNNQVGTNFGINSTNIWPTDLEWHYISVTYDGSYVRMYGDGNQIATPLSASGVLQDLTHQICLGASWGGASCTNADTIGKSMDDLKIYNYARTQEQILEDMSAQGASLSSNAGALKKPVLDLNFNEGQGATANDASGNANNGTLVSGATGGNTTATMMWDKGGKEGGAMQFDGADDVVSVPNVQNWLDLTHGSVSFWYKANGAADGDYSIFYQNGTGEVLSIMTTTGTTFRCIVTGNWINGVIDIPIPNVSTDTSWHHFVFTWDKDATGETLSGTIDGIRRTESDILGQPNSISGNFYLGARSDGSLGFPSYIDNVKVYNYALGEDEIKTLYNDSSAMAMGNDESRNNNGSEVTGANKDYCVPGDTSKCDKPVLELNLNEKSGTTAKDTSGSGNNGVLTNGPIWDRGKNSGGINFNGSGSYIRTSYNSNLELPNSGGTVSAWVKFDNSVVLSQDAAMGIFRKPIHDNWFAAGGYSLVLREGNLGSSHVLRGYFGPLGDVQTITGTTSIENNRWYNVALNWDNTNLYIYLDGKLEATTPKTKTLSYSINTEPLILGHQYSASSLGGAYLYLDGNMDDVRLYNYTRTPAQIAWDYNQGQAKNNWTFDEGTGTTAHDMGENKNHGAITGATWKNESECKNGKCLSFDGVNDYVDFSSPGTDKYPISFSAWAKPSTLTQNGIILSFDGTNVDQSFGIYNDGDKILISNNMYGLNGIANYLTAQKWQHWMVVFESATTFHFYLDGVEIPLVNVVDRYDVINSNIGARANGTQRQFNGLIDDVKIFNYALNAEQVKMEYNGGAVNFR